MEDVFDGGDVISTGDESELQRGSPFKLSQQYTGYSGIERRCSTYGEVGMHAAFEAHAQFALGRGGRDSACALTGACALARVGATAGTGDGVRSTVGWRGKEEKGRGWG